MKLTVESPWSKSAEDTCRQLTTDGEQGLSETEVAERQERSGPNQLVEAAAPGLLRRFFAQFADLMIALLAFAAVISALIGEWADSILIGIIVLANAVIGFVQEARAEKAITALKRLSEPSVRVRRSGRVQEIPATELVPGDVVELAAGNFVPADARLVQAADLEADESALTGESLPAEKSCKTLPPETGLPDRSCMLHSGTALVRGHASAVVTATGMSTELGKIATLLATTEKTETPLQRRLRSLGKRLAIVVVATSALIFAAGVLRESPENWNRELLSGMLLTAVSLAVAAIPEGLPAVITVTLALGAQRMAARNAIVRQLSAVETLGSVDVICSDKTGTLTQNRMTVADVMAYADGDSAVEELLQAGALCNDASQSQSGELLGSATETAILQAAIDHGLAVDRFNEEWPRLGEIPFSSSRKRMSTLHRRADSSFVVFTKGASEQVLKRCESVGSPDNPESLDDEVRTEWSERADALAAKGHRVLAVAARRWDSDRLGDDHDAIERSLCLLGLVGIVDPVRPEARDSIARCRSAGIHPVMITGDHQRTAAAIADELKLRQPDEIAVEGSELEQMDGGRLRETVRRAAVFARVSPEHKLRIVRAFQSRGNVVSMTGDGVNDAPALKQAEIGVAMGVAGTDVAKESAEMILADDNFATIVSAVEEGRVVYDNIRKFVGYLLTANTGEILVLLLAILAGLPLPLLPVHILWVNLVTDGLPALALGFEPAEKNLMQRQPRRRDESIFAGGLLAHILLVGLLMGLSCIGLFYWSWAVAEPPTVVAETGASRLDYARTMTFMALSMFQLFYVLAVRSSTELFVELGFWSNYRLTVAIAIGAVLQMAVVYVPMLQKFFHTVALGAADLGIVLAVSTTAFLAAEAAKLIRRSSRRE